MKKTRKRLGLISDLVELCGEGDMMPILYFGKAGVSVGFHANQKTHLLIPWHEMIKQLSEPEERGRVMRAVREAEELYP